MKEQFEAILANEDLAQVYDEDALSEMSEEHIEALYRVAQASAPQTNDEGDPDPDPEPASEPAAEPAPTLDLDGAFEEFGGVAGVKALLSKIKANETDRKAELVERLAANDDERAKFERLDLDTLEMFAARLPKPDYSGRGGGPQRNEGADFKPLDKRPVLNKKEAD